MTGVVKSWNGGKGYGFISCPSVQGDIMFLRTSLPEDTREVRGNFLEGRTVTFEAQQEADGRLKASSVLVAYVEGMPVAGQIKSYSDKNGYGFVGSTTLGQDVHFGAKDLAFPASRDVLKDQLVTFEVIASPEGKLRVSNMRFQSSKIANNLKNQMGVGMMGGMESMMGAMQGMQATAGGNSTGIVKSFSERNGYGFINAPGQVGDIKFGASDVSGGTIAAGTNVTFTTEVTPDGRVQAKNITAAGGMKRPASAMGGMGGMGNTDMMKTMMGMMGGNFGGPMKQQRSGPKPTETATGQYTSGTVKSYNGQKGFGFIGSPTLSSDAFFMKSSLPTELQSSHGNDITGQAVQFELAYTSDGKVRAQNISVA
jgi:cold shock CspA family protein